MNILIDADALVALYKRNDSNYQKARQTSQKIKKDHLYISPLTIPEAATVLSHKVSQEVAISFIIKSRVRKMEEISLSEDLIENADQIFMSQKAKNTSWPDCLNMAIIKIHHLDAIFSFDKIYAQNGLKTLDDN